MINDILTAAGFVEGETYKETRFISPPNTTFAIYNDSYTRRGADNFNAICEHDLTIELYEPRPDKDAEQRIETQLDKHNLEFDKQERYWIQEEQLYQVIYEFSYIAKGGI